MFGEISFGHEVGYLTLEDQNKSVRANIAREIYKEPYDTVIDDAFDFLRVPMQIQDPRMIIR